MSTLNNMEIPSKETKVVKLHVEGASNAVNTLAERKSGAAVSLVCPFPSLEVDVPVNFGGAEDGSLTKGTIHRIGVEDDPNTGLPRLRLSIRSEDGDVQSYSDMEMFHAPTAVTRDQEPESIGMEHQDTGTFVASFPEEEEEPAWASYSDCLPTPEEILERAQTRRRYRLSSAVAWCVVCMMLGAGGYLVYRTKVINPTKIREAIAAFATEQQPIEQIETVEAPIATEAIAEAPQLDAVDQLIQENTPQLASTNIKLNADLGHVGHSPIDEAGELEMPIPQPIENDDAEVVSLHQEEIMGSDTAPSTEVRLTLPTRWKPEYSTSYRVRNPHGVVVDVPGALVQREGWLKVADQYPMVRSIKAVQRETGARFIIYVNGELPRFMTSPRANGVSLRLYHDEPVEIGQTEKVAVARP